MERMRSSRSVVQSLRAAATSPASTSFICQSCRLSRRRYLSSTAALRQGLGPVSASAPKPPPPPSPPPPASGITALTSRRLISVAGSDAARYLQGVITSNILAPDGRPRDTGFYSAFLHAQGRVLHDVFIYPDTSRWGAAAGDSFLIEVDAAQADVLARHIRRYKLRARFDVRLLDEGEGRVWHVWDSEGGGASSSSSSGAVVGDIEALTSGGGPARRAIEQGVIAPILDPRFPGRLDARVVTLGGESAALSHPALVGRQQPVGEGAYRVRRYLHGVAEGQGEIIGGQALPAESNMDVAGAIDFRKGCYLGQELTIRTRHRGVVRKRILPCVLYGEGEPPPQRLEYLLPASPPSALSGPPSWPPPLSLTAAATADMVPPEASIGRAGKKGRSAGKWLAGVGNVGLALCRLEVMTDIVVQEADNGMFDPAAEFVVSVAGQGLETGGEGEGDPGQQQVQAVKIKAFVPDWLREGLAAQRADGHRAM